MMIVSLTRVDLRDESHMADEAFALSPISARASLPGDRWLIYNGLAGLPRWPGMMLSPWLQQEGEVRFYLLQQAPVPVEWVVDPLRIHQLGAGRGRLWLITHKCGFPNFPDNVLGYMRTVLAQKRGQPHHERIAFGAPEEIEVDLLQAPPGAAGAERR